jgi:hypothetical protein
LLAVENYRYLWYNTNRSGNHALAEATEIVIMTARVAAVLLFIFTSLFSSSVYAEETTFQYWPFDIRDETATTEYPRAFHEAEPIYDMTVVSETIVGCVVTYDMVTESHFASESYNTALGIAIFYRGGWMPEGGFETEMIRTGCE